MVRKATLFLTAAGLAIVLLPVNSSAQQPRTGRTQRTPLKNPTGVPRLAGESANPVLLALVPAVQSELKLTAAQKSKVQKLARTLAQGSGAPVQEVDPNYGTDIQADPGRQVDQALARILDRRQRERLNQIVLRAEGPAAITRPAVSDKLNLMPEQVEAIQTLMAQWLQSQNEALGMARNNGAFRAEPNPDEAAKLGIASSRLRARVAEQLGQILDRRQKNILDRMLGAPFDIGKLNDPADPADDSKPGAANPAAPNDPGAAKTKGTDNPKGKSDLPKRRRGKKAPPKSDS